MDSTSYLHVVVAQGTAYPPYTYRWKYNGFWPISYYGNLFTVTYAGDYTVDVTSALSQLTGTATYTYTKSMLDK
jgi:hypothetical protein